LNNINPYSNLQNYAFWKLGVAQEDPCNIDNIYVKKFSIKSETKIAIAGSCFAQHISKQLKINGFDLIDEEPAPPGLPCELHQQFGYSMYSARYGNIYSVKQLLQLVQEVSGERDPSNFIWNRDDRYFDALRPLVEPEGYKSFHEVVDARKYHIEKVKNVLNQLDLFIFTLGVTEMWLDKETNTVFPIAPGVIAGKYDEKMHKFHNAKFNEIYTDFKSFETTLLKIRDGRKFNILLTVSPVPLTATASGKHILVSNMNSKSILRAVAGQLAESKNIDYFPSFEIVNNPRFESKGFNENLRLVNDKCIKTVMGHFFKEHKPIKIINKKDLKSNKFLVDNDDIFCDELLIDSFNK